MHRYKRQVKRDTPLKAAPRRRQKLRTLISIRRCHTLLEEPEVDNVTEPAVKPESSVKGSAVLVHCKSVPRISSPAISKKPRTSPSVTAAVKKPGHQKVIQTAYLNSEVAPGLDAFKRDETPGSVTSCSMEPGSTLNSYDDDDDNDDDADDDDDDDDDDDTLYSYSSTTSSSLSSPEIFRKESSVGTVFPNKEELLGLYCQIKNSTLLDVSHAENVHMQHPPNLSTIIDASTVLAETNCEVSQLKKPEHRSKIQTDLFKSETCFKWKTSPKLTERMPIVFKKVCFKSPIVTETFKAKHITSSSSTSKNTSESSSLPDKIQPDTEINSENETLPFFITQKIPVKTRSEKAMFFDFACSNEKEAYFQKMRERCARLRSAVFFPCGEETQNTWSYDG